MRQFTQSEIRKSESEVEVKRKRILAKMAHEVEVGGKSVLNISLKCDCRIHKSRIIFTSIL